MDLKTTNELQTQLSSAPDLSIFLADNAECFNAPDFTAYFNELFARSGLTKASLAKRSATSEVYLYKILSGERSPSRDRTLCLCFGLSATFDVTQELLKRSGFAPLYAKNRRDAIIIYSLINGISLNAANERLFSEGEDTLC